LIVGKNALLFFIGIG